MNQPPQAHINTYLAVCTPSPEDGHHWSPRQLRSRRTLHPQPWPREIAKPCKINTEKNDGEAIGSKTTKHCNPRYCGRGEEEERQQSRGERERESFGAWSVVATRVRTFARFVDRSESGWTARSLERVSGDRQESGLKQKGEQPQLRPDSKNVERKKSTRQKG